jgi:hypothetical protein
VLPLDWNGRPAIPDADGNIGRLIRAATLGVWMLGVLLGVLLLWLLELMLLGASSTGASG